MIMSSQIIIGSKSHIMTKILGKNTYNKYREKERRKGTKKERKKKKEKQTSK